MTERPRTGNTDAALAAFWHPVATVDEVGPAPLHVQLAGRHLVVVQLGGQLVAFDDECPHRAAPLSIGTVIEDRLRCAYHGYCFDASGRCVDIPAIGPGATIPSKAQLRPVAEITVKWGLVWVAPLPPRAPLPSVPEWDDPAFGHVDVGPYGWRAGAAQMTENFLDVAHFPFVHAGTFGTEEDTIVADFSVQRDGLGFTYGYRHVANNPEDVVRMHGASTDQQVRVMEYSFTPPFSVILRVHYQDTGVTNIILAATQPEDDDHSRVYTVLLGNDFKTGDAEEARLYEEKILLEDQWMLESYRDRHLDLDLRRQVHTTADKMTVEYRRVMAEILSS